MEIKRTLHSTNYFLKYRTAVIFVCYNTMWYGFAFLFAASYVGTLTVIDAAIGESVVYTLGGKCKP